MYVESAVLAIADGLDESFVGRAQNARLRVDEVHAVRISLTARGGE